MSKAEQFKWNNSNHEEVSDRELWCEIKVGNQSAYSFLYKKYIKNLFKYGFFLVADKDIVEDSIHDIFVRIWSNKNNQIDIHCIKSYLYTSLRREVISRKKENLKITHQLECLDDKFCGQPSCEEDWIDHERKEEFVSKMRHFINHLSDRQREIIYLRFYQNLSYQEISHLLGIDQNYAYNLSSKAFAQLKKQISKL